MNGGDFRDQVVNGCHTSLRCPLDVWKRGESRVEFDGLLAAIVCLVWPIAIRHPVPAAGHGQGVARLAVEDSEGRNEDADA